MRIQLRSTAVILMMLCSFSMLAYAQTVSPQANQLQGKAIVDPGIPTAADFEAAHSQWSSLAPLPEPKMYHASTFYNGYVYVFGGYTLNGATNAATKKCYRYEVATDTWTPIADFPVSSFLHGYAFAVNDRIYLLGGSTYSSAKNDFQGMSYVYEYNPLSNSYAIKTAAPATQFMSAAGIIDNKIYLIGGRNNTAINSQAAYLDLVQIYDPSTDTWESSTVKLPEKVMYIGSATTSKGIVLAGGYSQFVNTYYTANVFVASLNAGTLEFNQVEDYPLSSIIFPCGAGVGSTAYFFGGRPSAFANAASTDWCYSYNVDTQSWKLVEKKITGFQRAQLATDGSVIYAPGGETLAGNSTVMEKFDPSMEPARGVTVDKNPILVTVSSLDTNPAKVKFKVMNEGPAPQMYDLAVNGDIPWLAIDGSTSGTLLEYGYEYSAILVDPSKMSPGLNTGSFKVTTSIPTEVVVEVQAYLSDAKASTDKVVLVEEFTGTWCGWCPYGVDSLKALEAQFGDRVAVISYHSGDVMENTTGAAVQDYIGVSGYPTAAIDRIVFDGETEIPISRTDWGNKVREVLDRQSSGIEIKLLNKQYTAATKDLKFTAEVTFLAAHLAADYRLMLVQTNNDRNFKQTKYNPTTVLDPFFHDHVADGIIPDEFGYQLGEGTFIMPNTKYTQEFWYTSADSIPSLSDLTLFVYEYRTPFSGPVLQAHFEPMTLNLVSAQPPALAGTFALEQNYPNPFNPSTTIQYNVPNRALVSLVVTDVLGREVTTLVNEVKEEGLHYATFNANGLQSGTYFVTMRSGSFVQTKSMTLMK